MEQEVELATNIKEKKKINFQISGHYLSISDLPLISAPYISPHVVLKIISRSHILFLYFIFHPKAALPNYLNKQTNLFSPLLAASHENIWF